MKKLICLLLFTNLWISSAVANGQTDVQTVVNKMMPIAEQLLIDHGEFFPFGGALKNTEEVVTLSGIDGSPIEQPAADEVIDTLIHSLRVGAENGDYRATAIVSNVNVVPPGKTESSLAIALQIEHRAGISLTLVFPYELTDGELKLGDLFAKGGENKIFSPPSK